MRKVLPIPPSEVENFRRFIHGSTAATEKILRQLSEGKIRAIGMIVVGQGDESTYTSLHAMTHCPEMLYYAECLKDHIKDALNGPDENSELK